MERSGLLVIKIRIRTDWRFPTCHKGRRIVFICPSSSNLSDASTIIKNIKIDFDFCVTFDKGLEITLLNCCSKDFSEILDFFLSAIIYNNLIHLADIITDFKLGNISTRAHYKIVVINAVCLSCLPLFHNHSRYITRLFFFPRQTPWSHSSNNSRYQSTSIGDPPSPLEALLFERIELVLSWTTYTMSISNSYFSRQNSFNRSSVSKTLLFIPDFLI